MQTVREMLRILLPYLGLNCRRAANELSELGCKIDRYFELGFCIGRYTVKEHHNELGGASLRCLGGKVAPKLV